MQAGGMPVVDSSRPGFLTKIKYYFETSKKNKLCARKKKTSWTPTVQQPNRLCAMSDDEANEAKGSSPVSFLGITLQDVKRHHGDTIRYPVRIL